MSLLLVQKDALHPFYSEMLDLRLWSLQELCYVIYHNPVLATLDFEPEALLSFLREDLELLSLSRRLAEILAEDKTDREKAVSRMLLLILLESGFYTASEAENCKNRMLRYRRLSRADRARQVALALFAMDRYRLAEECLTEELEEISAAWRKTSDAREKATLSARKSDIYCDLAVVKARLFEDTEALSFLAEAEETAPSERAARLRYFLTDGRMEPGSAQTLTEETVSALSEQAEAAAEQAGKAESVKELQRIRSMDPVKRAAAQAALLADWKKAWRRMKS